MCCNQEIEKVSVYLLQQTFVQLNSKNVKEKILAYIYCKFSNIGNIILKIFF